jgi:hypothetical protein
MSQPVKYVLNTIIALVWLFTAAVGFQAGFTEGDDSLLWFSPALTAAFIFLFFVSTVVFYSVERRTEARAAH